MYILLAALLPVCMKYTAQDESQVVNIARGEAECYICHKHSSITTNFKQYGCYKTVEPFDPPMQNTIVAYLISLM